ncbi:MAG: hypothetical protein R3B82_16375 [Sandaracinaceae bacterium]
MLQDLHVEDEVVRLRVRAAVVLEAPRLLLQLRGEPPGARLDVPEAPAQRVRGAAERDHHVVERRLDQERPRLVDVLVEGRDGPLARGVEVLVLAGEQLVPAAVGPLDLGGEPVHLAPELAVPPEVGLGAEPRDRPAELVERAAREGATFLAHLHEHVALLVGAQLGRGVRARLAEELGPPVAALDLRDHRGEARVDLRLGVGDLAGEGVHRLGRRPGPVEDAVRADLAHLRAPRPEVVLDAPERLVELGLRGLGDGLEPMPGAALEVLVGEHVELADEGVVEPLRAGLGAQPLELLAVDVELLEALALRLADERGVVEQQVAAHGGRGEAARAVAQDVPARQDEHRRAERAVERGVAALAELRREDLAALLRVVVVVALLVAEDRAEDLDVGRVAERVADVLDGEVLGPVDHVDEVEGPPPDGGLVPVARVVVEDRRLVRVAHLGVEATEVLELLERRVAVREGSVAVHPDDLLEGVREDREPEELGRLVVDEVAQEVREGEERARAGAARDAEVDEDLDRRAVPPHPVLVRAQVLQEVRDLPRELADLDRAEEPEPALDADLAGARAALLAEAVPGVHPLREVGVRVGEGLAAPELAVLDLVEVAQRDGRVDVPDRPVPLPQPREIGGVGVDRHEAHEVLELELVVLGRAQALRDATDGLAARAPEAHEERRGDLTRHDLDRHDGPERSSWRLFEGSRKFPA